MMTNNKDLMPIASSEYDDQYYKDFNRGFSQFDSTNEEHQLFNYVKGIIKLNIQSGNILDIGCGRGELLKLALEGNYNVVGIDYSTAALEYADQIASIVNEKREGSVSTFNMDAKKFSFESQKFDFITALDIVEHLHDWELALLYENIYNCMHKDSLFLLHTSPNKNIMIPIYFLAGIFNVKIKSSKFHINEQNIASLKKALDKYFVIEKLWFMHDDDYWFNATLGRSAIVRNFAKTIDKIIESKIIKYLMKNKSIQNILMSDIYLIARKK